MVEQAMNRRQRCYRCGGTGTVLDLRRDSPNPRLRLPREEFCPNPPCVDGWIEPELLEIRSTTIWVRNPATG